ncbi:MAG: radical SAM protein, partial [Planctomycetes bacterium]|nr:radical SAM protein [Planctomycetota bacterium]
MARLVRTTKCGACGESKAVISAVLGFCACCLRQADDARLEKVLAVHQASRRAYGLPGRVPRTAGGVSCGVCGNECQMGEGEQGYCGLRVNCGGKLVTLGGTPERGLVEWYYDPLPTNCVADWVCPGGVGAGYPKFAHAPGPERGYKNLAVFYNACTFNCLFCQNWHYRERQHRSAVMTADELAAAVDEATSCICYFGGDPTPQIAHALAASEAAL